MAIITSFRKDKLTLSYALNKSKERSAAEEPFLKIPSTVLITFVAAEHMFAPGTEQLWGDLHKEPSTEFRRFAKIPERNL